MSPERAQAPPWNVWTALRPDEAPPGVRLDVNQLVWGVGEPQVVLVWVAAGIERAMRQRRQEQGGDSPTEPPEELSDLVTR